MSPSSRLLVRIVAFAITALTPFPVFAQEFRGAISGKITESSGAIVPGARITVTNRATNAVVSATSNEAGDYAALYLTPGTYTVAVEAKDFKKTVRENVEVRVGDRLVLDLQLEVGGVSETVNVTADAPLLEASTASAGQVIDSRRISEMPLSDGNPFVLSRLAPGIAYTGDLKFSRPFDNAGTSSIVADGAPGRNEFTLDGVPNMASGGGLGRVAFVPPADAVQEFKVETASYDGQQSHTAGATVNVTLKSGSNAFHGTLYEFVRNDVLSANDFFLNRGTNDADKDGKADRAALRYNRYGGTIGGPIYLPRFGTGGKPYWSGKNRTFFFFSYEGLKDVFPEPGNFTVPTLAQRQGDFRALLPSVTIYDPATARADGARVRRDPIQCNGQVNVICPSRLSPIALNYLSYYPFPNQTGDAQGLQNYLSPNPRTDTFHSESYRFDQIISDRQKFFIRYTHNNRLESRNNWTDVVNGIRPIGNFLFRINNGWAFDHVYSFSPTTILNTRVGFSRFNEPNVRQHEGAIRPASLGFPASTAAYFGDASYMVRFTLDPPSNIGESLGATTTHNIYSFQSTLSRIVGRHSWRFGYDFRAYRENSVNPGNFAGIYTFSNNFTRGPLDTSSGETIGQQLATLLLGQPTGGSIERNAARSNQTLWHGMFVHDDWKVTSRLTVNLGLRYEFEAGTTERYNRNNRGFDTTTSQAIEAAAKAAYAVSPIPEVPTSAFQVKGGLLFATPENRGFWDADANNIQPRIGVAYRVSDKLVIRGGWGRYTAPFVIGAVNQTGFSQPTPIVPTLNNGLTFQATLANPWPTGVLTPPGSSLGIATFLGQGFDVFPVEDVSNTQAERWSFGFQYELPGNWLFELQYVGNRSYDGVLDRALNSVPVKYLSTSPVRDQATIDYLGQQVANPFRNLIPGTGFNGAQISRSQLLRPFPHFGGITGIRNDASSIFHSGQARLEKRFERGYTLLVSYTWSKFLVKDSVRNETDAELERRPSDSDIPHRVVTSGIWELPFGRNRKWGNSWNGFVDSILGGWQVQGIWNWQNGRPLTIGNVYYNGDVTQLIAEINGANADTGKTVFNTSGFYFSDAAVQTNGKIDPAKQRSDPRINLASNVRTLPSRFSKFRGQGLNLWDLGITKNFSITETVRFQVRGEFINAFNTPVFNNPNLAPRESNFGRVTSQANLARNVQIGLKLIF
jgi:Carboxypeptidase regulatory-like domain